MCVEYSGSDAVIPSLLCAFPGRMIMNNSLARLRQPVPPTFGVVKNHNNPSNAGIDFDQSAALRPCFIWIVLFPHGTLRRGGVRPCCQSSRLSSLSLPLSSPRLTELMQLILVPSVTSTATEYMFLMG